MSIQRTSEQRIRQAWWALARAEKILADSGTGTLSPAECESVQALSTYADVQYRLFSTKI